MSNQERADQLAREIDRLLAGERAAEGDPLLGVASLLAANSPNSLQPSVQAVARFEQQLDRWFGPASPPTPRPLPIPAILITLIVIVILILIVALIVGNIPAPLPPTIAPTIAPTTIPTTQPTPLPTQPPTSPGIAATIAPTIAPTQPPSTGNLSPTTTQTSIPTPLTATTIPYVSVVVEGQVQSIEPQTNIIVVRSQAIRLRAGDPLRLRIKVGNWVRVSGNLTREGEQMIVVAVIVVIIDTPAPVSAPGGSGGQGGQGGNGGSGGSDDDDDD
jgi:hypothetical protein